DNGTDVRTGDDIPMIAVDRTSGNLYVVWQDGRFSGTHDDIAFAMSTNGGLTWSAAEKINQTPTGIPSGDQQAFLPSIAVGANGVIAVSYYDFRNNTATAGLDTDYWLVTANPEQPGFTFGDEERLTSSSFNMELAPFANGLFVGDYQALYAGGNTANTFGALFGMAVSASDPSSIFFRGAVPPGAWAQQNGSVLRVDGTAGADELSVRVSAADSTKLEVVAGGSMVGTFDRSAITSIQVYGHEGDDT